MPLMLFVAQSDTGELLGFLEAGLRSFAEGCEPWQPVGYVEGWYVAERYRKQGIGGKLLEAAEEWARRQGCVEMASDALLHNHLSQ
jgi:aminoglycoside 6'-N-acetyltransferase I